jgi:hypothetical protein
MSAELLRKYLDIINESATQSMDFTQQALRSGIAKQVVGSEPKGYSKFLLYFKPLAKDPRYSQVDIRINAQGPQVPPIDDSLAVFDSRGQFIFSDQINAMRQRLLPNYTPSQARFTEPQKDTIKDTVFKMMHPRTTQGKAGAYQQVAAYAESKDEK